MKLPRYSNDASHWFFGELTSRIIAESGKPNDRYHMGKIFLQSFKDAPDFVMQDTNETSHTSVCSYKLKNNVSTPAKTVARQTSEVLRFWLRIDGGTDERETNRSALDRTVRCALAMKKAGLQKGDVIVLMAPNHIDLAIPFYAAFYVGVIVAAVDRTLGVQELKGSFEVNSPKLVFCQSEKAPHIQLALNELELDTQIVTFDKGDYLCSFLEFLESSGNVDVEEFKADDFDPEDTIALLIATSGTTGMPKSAAVTHKNLAITGPYLWSRFYKFPTPTEMALIGSPLQWLTALLNFILSPIYRYTRLQTSIAMTQQHAYHLINTYRPSFTIFSPTLMTTLLKPGDRDKCDFTCLDLILVGGSAVPHELVEEIKQVAPDAEVTNTYGMSELTTLGFHGDNPPPGSCGKPLGCFQYRLINVGTQEDIFEPNVPGELWVKGPGIFKEYYNNPKATEETFAEDRWFKTGDTFYRDDQWNFFFVERIKLLLKYKSYQISPVEIEGVIRQHPGVLDVAVTGIPDPECGDLPVACVVPRPGHDVNAQEIKDLVKETLSDAKQLRGGVIFLFEIPMTASTKVHRRKLKEIALAMYKQ